MRGLSRQDLNKAIKAMAALKTHPREESVNRLLLAPGRATLPGVTHGPA